MKSEKKIEGYKKIDLEEYRIITKSYRGSDKWEFESFPSDGIWAIQTHNSGKSSSKIIDIKKYNDLPQKYPLIELALRQDDISTAIMKFVDSKEKSLMELGKCQYSINELSEFIIKYFLSQEYGGGSRKFLLEKKWIKIKGDEHKRSWEF